MFIKAIKIQIFKPNVCKLIDTNWNRCEILVYSGGFFCKVHMQGIVISTLQIVVVLIVVSGWIKFFRYCKNIRIGLNGN